MLPIVNFSLCSYILRLNQEKDMLSFMYQGGGKPKSATLSEIIEFYNSQIYKKTLVLRIFYYLFDTMAINSWVLLSNSNVSDVEHFPNRRWFLKK